MSSGTDAVDTGAADTGKTAGTVAEAAADALRTAADFLESAAASNWADAESSRDVARSCRRIAEALPVAPRRGARRVLHPTNLEGRYHSGSQQDTAISDVAARLLGEVASLMQTPHAEDRQTRGSLVEAASELRRIGRLLALAPCARLGSRLNELLPYLQVFPAAGDMLAPQRGAGERRGSAYWDNVRKLMQDPGFWAVARDCYAMRDVGDLEERPEQMQMAWVAALAEFWNRRHSEAPPLTALEREQIVHAAHHPRAPWRRLPLLAGHWQELAPDDAAAMLCLIGAWHRAGVARVPLPLAHACDRVRVRRLACHGGVLLAEVQGQAGQGRPGIASFVLADHAVIAVDGGSAWIHDLNDLIGAQLHTPQARLDYLRLFASHVHGGEGRFVPLESLERVADRATDAAALQARLAPHVRDILPDGFDDEGYRRFRATICYGDALFDAVFALTPDGLLEMVDDEPVAEGLPLRNERLEGLFLVLDEE